MIGCSGTTGWVRGGEVYQVGEHTGSPVPDRRAVEARARVWYGRVAGGVSVERAQKGADRKNVSTSDPTVQPRRCCRRLSQIRPNQSSVYAHTLVRTVLPCVFNVVNVLLYYKH